MRLLLAFFALPLLVSACAPVSSPPQGGAVSVSQTCDASFYTYLIGEPIDVVYALNTPLRVRVLGAEDFVTRDFDANRLTFTTSTDDTVSRVFCG